MQADTSETYNGGFQCQIRPGTGFMERHELKFAFSLVDVLDKDRKDLLDENYLKFTHSVDKVVSKMIVLSLYFE